MMLVSLNSNPYSWESVPSSALINVDMVFRDGCMKRLKTSTTFDWLSTIVKPIGASSDVLFSEDLLSRGMLPIIVNANFLSGSINIDVERFKTVLVWRRNQKRTYFSNLIKKSALLKRCSRRFINILKDIG